MTQTCERHSISGCEWCFAPEPAPTQPQPSLAAVSAAEAITTASYNGLVTIYIDPDLQARMCELHLLFEDEDGDACVDYEGSNWLISGADVMVLDSILDDQSWRNPSFWL